MKKLLVVLALAACIAGCKSSEKKDSKTSTEEKSSSNEAGTEGSGKDDCGPGG